MARLARLFRASRDAWRAKAPDKQQRLRAARVKIRDLEASRAYWKDRAPAAEGRGQTAVSEATPAGETEEPDAAARQLLRLPPPGHRHSLLVMQLTLRMYPSAGLGSRGVPRVPGLLAPWMPVSLPAQTTVLNWVYRCGLAILLQPPQRREDWIFIADHTLELGTSKCLVIPGIPAARLLETGYSPSHRAMQVLAVEVTTHSTGEWVAAVLREFARRTGVPVQIVADHGSDLHKGITLFRREQATDCVKTYDISHRIATLLKAELQPDARWKAFLAHCARTLASCRQTDLAFLLPPRQRTKARFMHVDTHVEWAQNLLADHDRGDFSAIRPVCSLTVAARDHLRDRLGVARVRPLHVLLGYRHPDKATFLEALQAASDRRPEELDDAFWDLADTGRARFLSAFAKYTTCTARGPLKEIGRLMLAIPAFLTDLTGPIIHEAMTSVRTLDVEQWVKRHLGDSMRAPRRQAFKVPKLDMKTA